MAYIKQFEINGQTYTVKDRILRDNAGAAREHISDRVWGVELPNQNIAGYEHLPLPDAIYTIGATDPYGILQAGVTIGKFVVCNDVFDPTNHAPIILDSNISSITAYNGDFWTIDKALNIVLGNEPYYIRISCPYENNGGFGADAIFLLDLRNPLEEDYAPHRVNFYMVSNDYSDRWNGEYTTNDAGESVLVMYAIQEGAVVDRPAHIGSYTSPAYSEPSHDFETDSKLSSVSLSVSGSYSNHTHTMNSTPTGFVGSVSYDAHTHSLGTSTTPLGGSVSVDYNAPNTSTGSKSQTDILGSSFSYTKATGASDAVSVEVTAGAYVIYGSNFYYLKNNTNTAEGGTYTVNGSNFEYTGNTVGMNGTTLVLGTETRKCDGSQIVNAHVHTIATTPTGMTNSQTIAVHTHSVTNSSAKMTGQQDYAAHTHTIGTTSESATIIGGFNQIVPSLVSKASVTLNGSNFTYDKATSMNNNSKVSFTSSQTKDTTHQHTVTVAIGAHHHTVSVRQ